MKLIKMLKTNQFNNKLEELILKACYKLNIPLNYNKKGPKIFTETQKIFIILLQVRSKKSLRDFVEEFKESQWIKWLQLKQIPSYRSIDEWKERFDSKFIRKLNQELLKEEKSKIMAIDGSGIDSWKRSRHYEKRIGEKNLPFNKFNLLIDVYSFLIHDWDFLIKPRHDLISAFKIVKRRKWKGILLLLDKGYDCERLHKIVSNKGGISFAPVRNHKKNPKGINRKRCKLGNEKYPLRNCVESSMHRLKNHLYYLFSKKGYKKKREFAWNIIFLNIKRRISFLCKIYFNLFFKFFEIFFNKIKIYNIN